MLGDKGLAKGMVEYKGRRDREPHEIALGDITTVSKVISKSER